MLRLLVCLTLLAGLAGLARAGVPLPGRDSLAPAAVAAAPRIAINGRDLSRQVPANPVVIGSTETPLVAQAQLPPLLPTTAPTATAVPPTPTPIPPTATAVPPTATTVPTATALPPTATATAIPPTATPTVVPTATAVPPTATVTPTATATVSATATLTPSVSASPSASASASAATTLAAQSTAGRLTIADASPNDRLIDPGSSTTYRHTVTISCVLLGCTLASTFDVVLTLNVTGLPLSAVTLTNANGNAVTGSGTGPYVTRVGCLLLGGVVGCGGEIDVTVAVPAGTAIPYSGVVTTTARLSNENVTPARVVDRLNGQPSVTLIVRSNGPTSAIDFGSLAVTGQTTGTNPAVVVQDGLLGPTFIYPSAVTATVVSNISWTGTCRVAAGSHNGLFPVTTRLEWRPAGSSTLSLFPPEGSVGSRDACFPADTSAPGTHAYTWDLAIVVLTTDPPGQIEGTITYRVSQ